MSLLFSDFLERSDLQFVNYYTYYPVIEKSRNGVETCRILPSDDAVSYIIEFETKTKKLLSGEINWFNEHLFREYDKDKIIPESRVSWQFAGITKKRCIVINLIDFCYGHSFVKLLNILDFHKKYSGTHDLVIISFGYIREFLPDEKFNIVELQLSFSEAQKAYSFKEILKGIREKYEEVDFAVLDAYKRFESRNEMLSFYNFFGKLEDPYKGKNIITFNYRKGVDRSWAGKRQASNVIKYFTVLREYFDAATFFCVIGEKDDRVFPDWVLDKRIQKFPNPILHEYHYILQHSVITIGMLGSHMLSASVLSQMTLHLTPEVYLRVAATDIINHSTYSSPSYFEHVYIEGNSLLTDHSPKSLAYKTISLFLGKISLEYKEKCLLILKEKGSVVLQKDYILEAYSFFNYDRFIRWKDQMDKKHFRLLRMQAIIAKIKLTK
jgi:hypothetical protein